MAALYKLELAQFIELQSFSQFASDLGQESKNRLTKGLRLVEISSSISKEANREIYLLLRRPAGREAYPGEIFFVHSNY